MSDTQFSSLSPNSSNDLEISAHCVEDDDQETLSITSDKSVANLEDFGDVENYKTTGDPFLSDFMKEDIDEAGKIVPWLDTYADANEMSVFFDSENTENDLDNFLSVASDCLDGGVSDLLEWDTASPATSTLISAQKPLSTTFSIKRAFSPIDILERRELPLPTKQRRVDVSSHMISDEWIRQYHDNISFKASGVQDRRKTKHHKVLSEFGVEQYGDTMDCKRNRDGLYTHKQYPSVKNVPSELSSTNSSSSLSISTSANKFPTIRTISITQEASYRKSMLQCSNHYPENTRSHITPPRSHHDQPSGQVSSTLSSVELSASNCSTTLSDIVEMPRVPAPLRMGKRVCRRGHRLSLWQYLLYLLDSSKYREQSTGIKWINRSNGVFHIVDSKQVATLWGEYKERRDKMTYDSLARSLRHYYKKKLMAKINNRRLVYQVAQECIQWSSETFLKRNRS